MVCRYDRVFEGADGFYRARCKTAHLQGHALKFSTKSRGRRYEGEVDYFGIYEPTSGNVYIVPIEIIGSNQSITLRLAGRAGKRYAERFLLSDKSRLHSSADQSA